ncbi:MAG: metalloprotease [Ignavibacteriota bacterium]|nr:MAG: metalloprotease [Chlorobiota bacterium]MBE7477488.1 neutral zinc metallopeptidase [Ignavibacteriales bacterium]MBL1123997.1 metalloprotease [Ignavibacteriota bacterium]MCC7093499.1 neutral zinc metallopeptidase [Ignavibacteriaceae bacterium]MCE7857269.1 metalloprotease [Ignavibacteria bacterium CHB3]MEB2296612.1 zinc metallopeptidase [Ignavibacteria bacterium]
MRWKGRRESSNVEDRRGGYSKGMVGGGIGSVVVILLIYFLGGDPSQIMNTSQLDDHTTTSSYQGTAEENELAQFVSVVLAETEDVWTQLFLEDGLTYKYPKLVLYTGSVQSACGFSSAATGPFYCPGDYKLYIDLSFYDELKTKFKAPGDFAMAYVVAHEVGHHVQTLLGINEKVNSLRSRLSEKEFNKYLVRLELQADYLAGVWAHYANRANLLEEGDIDEALNAASAVGDDRIQKSMQGYVVPESFTHGTSEQRKRWFYKGFNAGNLEDGDTFSAENL